jgi:hypothetical protein
VFSTDVGNGLSSLERKLVFVVFPMVMAGEEKLSRLAIEKILMYFVVSCVLGMLYCEYIGIHSYFASTPHNFHFLVYELLASPLMHPGYVSNFMLFGVIWLSLPLVGYEAKLAIPLWLRVVLLLLLMVFIVQLTSKTVFIILVFYIPWWLVQLFKTKLSSQNKKYFAFAALSMLLLFVGFLRTVLWGRFAEVFTIKPVTNKIMFYESIMSRIAATTEALEKVKPVWYKGFGTGMANSMLIEQFKLKGYADLIKHNMHNHNQYMRTWLDIGLFGVLYIIAVFVISALIFKAKKEWAGFWMVIITLINCFTDDMLDIQSGVIFFLFFIGLFLWVQDVCAKNLYGNNKL